VKKKNIRWKIEIPGKGSSSPIVWDDRIYLTTAIATDKAVVPATPEAGGDSRRRGIAPTHVQKFVLLALSRHDGKVIWQQTAISATRRRWFGNMIW
jgi:hypothetical protein